MRSDEGELPRHEREARQRVPDNDKREGHPVPRPSAARIQLEGSEQQKRRNEAERDEG